MEVKPSKKAVIVWFFEKGPFWTLICILCFYLVFASIDSLPLIYNSQELTILFSSGLAFLSLLSLGYEYRTKKYYILKTQVHVRRPFGIDRARFDQIDDIKIVKTPIHKIMKVGDILVKHKNGNIAIECVKDPEKIHDHIYSKISGSITKK